VICAKSGVLSLENKVGMRLKYKNDNITAPKVPFRGFRGNKKIKNYGNK